VVRSVGRGTLSLSNKKARKERGDFISFVAKIKNKTILSVRFTNFILQYKTIYIKALQ
jgi:hypothetical protein